MNGTNLRRAYPHKEIARTDKALNPAPLTNRTHWPRHPADVSSSSLRTSGASAHVAQMSRPQGATRRVACGLRARQRPRLQARVQHEAQTLQLENWSSITNIEASTAMSSSKCCAGALCPRGPSRRRRRRPTGGARRRAPGPARP